MPEVPASTPPARRVTIGLVQMAASGDRDENLARALQGVEAAAARGARIVCLQELFRTPYFCSSEDHEAFDLAEPVPGPTTAVLAAAAKRLGVALLAPVFERRAPGLYHNTVAVLGPDGAFLGRYRKMHIPDDPLYYEKFYFAPGDTGFVIFHIAGACVAPLICWDQWYPEAARLAALSGAEILFYPTAIGWHEEEREALGAAQKEAWEVAQRAHAIANGVFVACANRVGREGTVEFWGGSFACDPSGRVLARAGSADEVLVVSCDLDRIEETRRHWPFLRDRRIDAYGGLERRWLGD